MNLPRLLPLFAALLSGLALSTTARADPLKVGDAAPDVTGTTDTGASLHFADVYKQGYTLVYFYPMADTPGCTAQGCSLRDANAELARRGVTIIGVSTDSVAAQQAFKAKYHFPFTLIADTDRSVLKAFGQAGTGRAHREAYLIKDGKIVYKDEGVTARQGENVLHYLAAGSDAK